MQFTYNDGGRQAAGYKGFADDCVCRAVAIASKRSYEEVYKALGAGAGSQRKSKGATARNGIKTQSKWFKAYMVSIGFEWVPTMAIGMGCLVHLKAEELPAVASMVVLLSKHATAVVNSVIHDIYDPSRNGTRCVYGYWLKKRQ